ncbi:Cysteine desulfurase [Aquicella siphonis]|uniref:Cysteine desulfurase n=1 Tax=Aquicella siphonis TaxID=254247 RepID=A0A5E4PCX4_9COXI|nr:cysteine desulfurase [Aquicella siphonis]VVC74739.1 Cysteine desulfurase [Aquicella siphonis]
MNMKTLTTDFTVFRRDFPVLQETNRGRPVIYLDSAASAQKPRQVVDAVSNFYFHDYANIHRGIYELSERATRLYEQARDRVKNFIHAAHAEEIVFVRGTTEGINLVAQSFGRPRWQAGDEVILSTMEHHSNIVPWYLLKEQLGIVLKVIPVTDEGAMDIEAYEKLFSPRTRMVAVTHASNVLGTVNPVKEMASIAHAHQVPVLIDGAQAVPHMPVDVQDIDCDFYVFSGHKLYGPTGIGILYGKKALLDAMPPYQGGGDMIETVAFSKVTFAKTPQKFEAGTPDIAGVIGLAAAIDYVQSAGMQQIYSHEQILLQYAEPRLLAVPGLRIIGTTKPKVGVISFVMQDIHPHDIGTVLDHEGIAVRAGHHCAMPLMERFRIPATVRASFGIYNDENDVDALMAALHLAKRLFG